MAHLLAGDIGGTKTALSLYEFGDGAELHEVAAARYPSGDFSGLTPLVREFLRAHTGAPSLPTLRAAGFGVAGPVEHGICKTTNLPWVLDQRQLSENFGAPTGLINDFHAVALGVGELYPSELEVLQQGEVDPRGPIAIIGAGTGLGEAILVPTDSGTPVVVPTEGGHADFAPRNDVEIDVLRWLWKRHSRVSIERVVSGLGIKNLYDFVTQTGLHPESPAVRGEMETTDPGKVIGSHALAATDPACVRAIDLFVSSYGAEAGNFALKTFATGGVYVTGGIAPQLIQKLRDGSFMHAFLDKGRMAPSLERMRVSVVLNSQVGLLGARKLARDLAART